MNIRLVCRQLGKVCLLIGAFMLLSLPWAHPSLGWRDHDAIQLTGQFERTAFFALLYSLAFSVVTGLVLLWVGRHEQGRLYRKEAMAVVGLSWVMATVLGALPFYFGNCARGYTVRLDQQYKQAYLLKNTDSYWAHWHAKQLSPPDYALVVALTRTGADGLSADQLAEAVGDSPAGVARALAKLTASDADWAATVLMPGETSPWVTPENYRLRIDAMSFVDTLFESQSGFSTTGATVITNLEDPRLVPHCLLFWRSSTHFLGGLGIIVLFVVILGHGSAGKALMQAELPGPTQESPHARMQHAAWLFAATYVSLNVMMTLVMRCFGLTWFDALCHAFGTMATGGFSTYNASLGHFNSPGLEYVTILFMLLAGSNFTLLVLVLRGKPLALLRDVEWQAYMLAIVIGAALIIGFGLAHHDFGPAQVSWPQRWFTACRFGLFQVVSIMTTTGFGTQDFDQWNQLSRGVLLALMFVGGCAGSTGGGLKVIRHVLMLKILHHELELSFRPTVVRPLKLGGKAVDDPLLKKNILVYFAMIMFLFVASCIFVLLIEPDATWGVSSSNKLIDTGSAVAAMLNNIGPGLGTVGASCNYAHLSAPVKLLFTWLMMLGRVEVFVILCLFVPRFWRSV